MEVETRKSMKRREACGAKGERERREGGGSMGGHREKKGARTHFRIMI